MRSRFGRGVFAWTAPLAVALLLMARVGQARDWSMDLTGPKVSASGRNLSAAAAADSTVVRSHRLEAGATKVSGLAVGDTITFALFSDKTLTVTLVEETPALAGRSFLGRIDNALGALGCVVLETSDGVILDVTDFERGRVWQVVSDANDVTVREVKPSEKPRTCGGTVPPLTGTVSRAVSSAVAAVPGTRMLAAAAEKPTVDILVNYDTEAAAWAKSNGGGVQQFAETCVQKMNTALANTGLNQYFRFRLVGVYEVGKSADGNPQLGLYLARGENVNYGGTMVYGWTEVLAERERVSADIVCTLVDDGTDWGTTGIGTSLTSSSGDSAGCGFNACLIRAVANSHTMTHEVGHNMGAGHSDAMADKSNCGPQYYSYSSGYYFYVGGTGYYTIMSYNADGYGNYYTEVPYFSSPNYSYKGVAVGNATHDNTRTLQQTYTMVVNNRKPPFVSAEIGQGLDAEAYAWTTDGSYPWSRVTDCSDDGVDSSRSCEMSGNTTSWAETRVVGPATLTFKLRLRTYGGWFNVLTDGTVSYTYGNSTTALYGNSWESASVSIPAGTHTVRLAYTHPSRGYTTGGNGAWVDRLSFAGGKPADEEKTETTSTEVPVPFDWLAAHYPKAATSDYETLAAAKGANGYTVWQSYVAGLDPTDEESVFKAVVTVENGVPVVTYEPELTPAQAALRTYTTYGKKTLKDLQWQKVTSGNESAYKFFYVTVEMK